MKSGTLWKFFCDYVSESLNQFIDVCGVWTDSCKCLMTVFLENLMVKIIKIIYIFTKVRILIKTMITNISWIFSISTSRNLLKNLKTAEWHTQEEYEDCFRWRVGRDGRFVFDPWGMWDGLYCIVAKPSAFLSRPVGDDCRHL